MPPAMPDTVYLKNGVQIHGKIISQDDKVIRMQIGDRKTAVRVSETVRTEENDKTGKVDLREARRRAEERNQELTERTGLDAKQRARVEQALSLLGRRDDPNAQAEGRRLLLALAQEMDVYRYLEHTLVGMLPYYVPGVLEVMVTLNPLRALPHVRNEVFSAYAPSRATALTLLARMQDREAVGWMVQGLLDHEWVVCVAAANAIGALGVREATPVLLENLKAFDLRIQNSSRSALENLWSTPDNPVHFAQRSDWEAFWQAQAPDVPNAYDVRQVEPLVPEGTQFQDE